MASFNGTPLLIAPMADDDLYDILRLISGLVLTGGKDYDLVCMGLSLIQSRTRHIPNTRSST